MLYTTLNLAKSAHACSGDFLKVFKVLGGDSYGWDNPVPLSKVLEIAGFNAAIWCLRCVLPEEEQARDRMARLFACDCAEAALPIFERARPNDARPRETIAVARRFAVGEASREELDAARAAAYAADAAAYAAYTAAYAARATQTQMFLTYLNATSIGQQESSPCPVPTAIAAP